MTPAAATYKTGCQPAMSKTLPSQSLTHLDDSQQLLQLLIDGVVDYAIYMLDCEGLVHSWNSGAQRIKGYLPEEILGQHFSRFYVDEDRAKGCLRRHSPLPPAKGDLKRKAGECARMAAG